MDRTCGWTGCRFCEGGICTQKDGGGHAYGLNAYGRYKYSQQSEEVRRYCRCCVPDLGQYEEARDMTDREAAEVLKRYKLEDPELVDKAIRLAVVALELQDGNLFMEDVPSGTHIGTINGNVTM